jgi:hypothetical protein
MTAFEPFRGVDPDTLGVVPKERIHPEEASYSPAGPHPSIESSRNFLTLRILGIYPTFNPFQLNLFFPFFRK